MLPEKRVPPDLLRIAANSYEHLGRKLEEAGSEFLASFGYLAAAEIDGLNEALRNSWGGPFNGQACRRELFWDLVRNTSVEVIVETGTFRGTTTEDMARNFSGPIYTCETNRRYFEYSKHRLAPYPHVHVDRIDSRLFLGHLLKTAALSKRVVLFYLDAHWNDDLPVHDELALIFNHRAKGLVMIDDFQVPFDPGYGFDDYGDGKKLCIEILYPYRERLNKAYFPAAPASRESGQRRGAVICPLTTALDDLLCNMPSLSSVRL